MSEPAAQPWSMEQLFDWQARQTERYELVGGVPVRLMAGARNVHDDIVVNLLAELRRQLRGFGCRPFTGDGSIETLPGQIRRPDIGVDRGKRDPNAMRAANPRLIAEVLSATTRDFDTFDRLDEYKQVASLDYPLLIEPNAAQVAMWSRGPDGGWTRTLLEGLERSVDLPAIGVTLALAEIYDGVGFPTGPRLVREAR